MAMVSGRLPLIRMFWRSASTGALLVFACTLLSLVAPTSGASLPQNSSQSSAQDEPKAATIPVPLPKGKKLILKDGSFQVCREYKREGDSVRYYSVERSAWEEIPAELV